MDGFQKDMTSSREQMEKILQEMKIQIYKVYRKFANSFIYYYVDMLTVYFPANQCNTSSCCSSKFDVQC